MKAEIRFRTAKCALTVVDLYNDTMILVHEVNINGNSVRFNTPLILQGTEELVIRIKQKTD